MYIHLKLSHVLILDQDVHLILHIEEAWSVLLRLVGLLVNNINVHIPPLVRSVFVASDFQTASLWWRWSWKMNVTNKVSAYLMFLDSLILVHWGLHLLVSEGLEAGSGRGQLQPSPANVHLDADQPVVELCVETRVLYLRKKELNILKHFVTVLTMQPHWQPSWNTRLGPPASGWRWGSSPGFVSRLLSWLRCSFPGQWDEMNIDQSQTIVT